MPISSAVARQSTSSPGCRLRVSGHFRQRLVSCLTSLISLKGNVGRCDDDPGREFVKTIELPQAVRCKRLGQSLVEQRALEW